MGGGFGGPAVLLAWVTRSGGGVLSAVLLCLGYLGDPLELCQQLFVGGLVDCVGCVGVFLVVAVFVGARPPEVWEAPFEVPGSGPPVSVGHRGPDWGDAQFGSASLGSLYRVEKVQVWPVVWFGLVAPVELLAGLTASG